MTATTENAFMRTLLEQRKRRDAAHAEGVPALRRLLEIARCDTGQSRRVAAFLLGLYNGTRFPFDLTDLRSVDAQIFEDCMLVLRMDSAPMQEVHRYFQDGSRLFESLAQDHRLVDHFKAGLVLRQLRRDGVTSFGSEAELRRQISAALNDAEGDSD